MRLIRSLLIVSFLLMVLVTPTRAAEPVLRVYYAGPEGSVKTALTLAKFDLVSDPADADVLVLNETIPDPAALAARLKAGAGGLLIMGPEITAQQAGMLLGAAVQVAALEEPVTLSEDKQASDDLVRDILWNTAPQVRERYTLAGGALESLLQVHSAEEMIIGSTRLSPASPAMVYTITARLDGDNGQFRDWGYYNYLIYNLVTRSAGRTPLSFGSYPGSPVPHPNQRLVLYGILLVFLAGMITAFILVRRYSLAHPEALNGLVRNVAQFTAREAGTDWEQVGFHRPLGGFMFALMMGIILFIPLTVYNDMILPVYILPSAQAMGIYGRVAAFFPLVWSLFDMGTSVAHMKYFSEYRVRNPQRAIQYAQFYVWWQALTGAVQVALVVFVAGTFLPQSVYALYAWAVITHVLIQIPGFYRLFTDAFSGIQRSDYGTILDMGINLVFPMIAQPIVVSLMVWWGRSNPVFGQSMGGVLGLGLAAYLTELMSFTFGWYLYRRLGYNPRLLMMAHFSWDVAWDSLKFGVFLFLGGLVGGLGSIINVTVVQNRLLNNNEILGNLSLAGSFVFAFTVFQALTGAMMPSISEAVSNGRKVLAQYYSANGYKYGGLVTGMLAAVLLSVADRFILGSSGPSFQRAAIYVVPSLLAGALSFASWNAECVLYGAGKTRLTTVLALVELTLSLSLSMLLIDRFQVYALLAVPFITRPVHFLLAYYLNHHFSFPQRFYFWQSAAAPLLASLGHYAILRVVTGFIWQKDEITSIIILVVALIPSFPIYAFLYGLAGGWDDNTLEVFDRGTRLASFMKPFTRSFYHATALGARLSPLHNRFPFTIHAEAMAEAEALTKERVSLVSGARPDSAEALVPVN